MTETVFEMNGVGLRRSGNVILNNVSWRMEPGQHWAVIGANGSGKTTLLRIVGGILFPSLGTVSVLGERFGRCDLLRLRQRIGWVGPAILGRMPPGERLADIVASGFKATFGLVYELEEGDRKRVDEALEQVGMSGRGDAEFGVLSQGEQQRALFARSLLTSPELFILDEACSGLDLPARESFLGVVEEVMATAGAGVIMVTHHIEEIPAAITHALVLKKGTVLAAGPVGEVITGPILSDAFGMRIDVDRVDGRYWARASLGRRA